VSESGPGPEAEALGGGARSQESLAGERSAAGDAPRETFASGCARRSCSEGTFGRRGSTGRVHLGFSIVGSKVVSEPTMEGCFGRLLGECQGVVSVLRRPDRVGWWGMAVVGHAATAGSAVVSCSSRGGARALAGRRVGLLLRLLLFELLQALLLLLADAGEVCEPLRVRSLEALRCHPIPRLRVRELILPVAP
jgi:hypothetical protein